MRPWKFLEVDEMIAGGAAFGAWFIAGARITQAAEMQHAGAFAVTAPELGQRSQISGVDLSALVDR